MIKYMCDIENCGKEAELPDGKEPAEMEFFDHLMPDKRYCWGRVGIMNITLCSEHRREAMRNLIKKLQDKYLR
jgi:hypothetical protein